MKSRIIRWLYRLLRAGVGWALLGACAPSPPALKVANWAGPEEIAIEEENLAAFRRDHPGVDIVLEPIPANYQEKILTSIAAGTPPDVFLLDSIIIPVFIKHGLILDLQPFVEKYQVDLTQYYPHVLAIAQRGEQLYALPKDFTPMVLYYNKDLLDQAGLPYPQDSWTWPEFRALAQQLTRDTDGDGRLDQFGTVTYSDFFYWPPWVWSNGGDFLDPTGKQASGFLNAPPTVAALQFLIDLRRGVPPVAPTAEALESMGGASNLFYAGRVAMVESGHWWLPQLRRYITQGKLRVGVAPLPIPVGGEPVTVLYESGWCVSAETKRPDLAAQLALYLSSIPANRLRMAQGLAIPSNIELAEEALQEDSLGLERVFYEQIGRARAPWGTKVEKFNRVEDWAQEAFEEALIGGRDLGAALAEAATKIDRELALEEPRTLSGRTQIQVFLAVALGLTGLGVLLTLLRSRGPERRETLQGYTFLFPSLLHLVLFSLGPVLFSLYLAFHRWSIVDPSKPFIGLDHFRQMLGERLFWNAVKNTAFFTLHVPLGMALALLIALLLNRPGRGQQVLRTVFFLPSVCSFVAIAMVWQWLYNPDYGLFNYVLNRLGLPTLGFLTDPRWALPSLMLMAIWLSLGYQMVIFLAGLQGIPGEFFEAAALDGAGPWTRFRYITLPLLQPTTFFVLVTSVIASFQVFTSIYVMTQGGPLHATDVIVYHIYQNAWEYLKMGYASALAWVLFLLILLVTWIQFKYMGKEVTYSP